MAKREVDIKVKYIPDTSALKSALSGAQKIDFKIGGSGLKKELLAPVQNAMKEVNKAIASGADNKTLLKLFQDVGKAADLAKNKAQGMLNELNTVFSSSGNQKLLTDLKTYEKELEKSQKKLAAWDKKYSTKTGVESDYSKLRDTVTKESNGNIKTLTEARAEIKKLTEDTKELSQVELERLNNLQQFAKLGTERQNNPRKALELDVNKYQGLVNDTKLQVQTPNVNIEGTKTYTAIIRTLGEAAGLSTQEINKLTAALKVQDDVVKKNKKELTKFGDIVTGTFLGTSIGNLFQTGIQRGIQFFKEYDETLTRTMMVTGMTREEVNGLTSSYNKLANQLSSTTKDVAAAQLVFYQQGLGTKEAMEMTEASIAISKTGGIEAGEAANRLTAAIRGYQLAANDAMDIADKMSALDAAAASSVDELTVAMQKSASQARMAGLDLDYYMAYLSTMQEVTREAPENIGTAMKSITSRMQEIRDIGKIEEDGTTFSNVAKALTSIGIAATDSSGQLRNLQDIMNELGPMWATLDRNHKAYIATTLAGNRQQSRFIALMDNYDRALELVDVSQNASGESAKQLRAYNQGLEASFTALSNAWQQFATKLADSEVIKRVVDLLTDIIELFNKLPKGVTSTLIPMAALIKIFTTLSKAGNLFKGFKDWGIEQLGLKDITTDMGSFNKTINSSIGLMSKWGNSIKKALDGWGNNVYISDTTKKIEDFTTAEKAASAAQIMSDPTQQTEALLNTNIAASAESAKNAYVAYNEALTENAQALTKNDLAQTNEYQDNLQSMVDNINANIRLENKSSDEIAALEKKVDKAKARDFSKELSSGSAGQRRTFAERYLRSQTQDPDETMQDLLKRFGTKGKKLTGDTQKDLLNFAIDNHGEIAKYLEDQNKATVAEMEKSLDQLYEKHNEIHSKTLQLQAEYNTYFDNIENSPEGQRAAAKVRLDKVLEKKNYSFQDMKSVVTDKQLTNIEKFTSFTSKLNIGSGLVAGSLTQMGASLLGLDDDMSSALSTSVGLATAFAKFAPPWGAIIGASLGGIKLIFDKMWPSIEKTQQRLVELQQEMDELAQKRDNISNSLSVYEDLYGKLNKTEEETQQLKDSTERLAELIPGIVMGYNEYGEAVINTAKAYEELDKKQKELEGNANKQLSGFTDLQKGAQKTEKTLFSIFGVINAIATVGAFAINPFLGLAAAGGTGLGMMAWDEKISEEQVEENRKVFEENFAEIQKAYQTKRDAFLLNVREDNKDTASKVIDAFINDIMDTAAKGGITDYEVPIEQLLDSFQNIDWSIIEDARTHLETSLQFGDKTLGEAREKLENSIKKDLQNAGLQDIEIRGIITAILNITYDGAASAAVLKDQIDAEIARINAKENPTEEDEALKSNLEIMKKDIDNLTKSELELLNTTGLLRTEYAALFGQAGGMDELLNKYVDENGELDKNKAIIGTINDLLGQRKTTLEEINKLEKESNSIQSRYETQLRSIAQEKADNIVNLSDEERAEYANKYYEEMIARLEGLYTRLDGKDVSNPLSGRREYVFNDYDSGTGYDFGSRGLFMEDSQFEDAYSLFVEYKHALEETDGEIKELTADTKIFNNDIDELFSLIESYEAPTFGEMGESLNKIQSSFEEINSLMESLAASGRKFSLGDVGDLFSILDTYEQAVDLTNSNSIATQNYFNALEKINNAMVFQNGQLTAQEGLEEGLYQLSIAAAQAKMEEYYIQIEQTRQELEYQNAILATEKEAIDAIIHQLKTKGEDADITAALATAEGKLEANLAKVSIDNEISKLNARLQAASEFGVKYAKIMREAEAGTYEGGVKGLEIDTKQIRDQMWADIEENAKSMIDLSDIQGTIADLEAYSAGIGDQIKTNQDVINTSLDMKEKISKYLSDPHALGSIAQVEGMKDASSAQEDYNEKLERTLTLLEKIEGLQHAIDENETFKSLYEGYDGEAYGRLLMSNLNLAQQQYEVYKDLFAMQQEMTNQAAGDLLDSPYGQMFKIMDNGDIGWADASMYDKYKNLPDDMQEDIDNLVEAFQKQRDALRDTEQDLSKYAQEVKEVREELVAMEIEIENELVEAIKNREKILHDARMKALDDEVAMIEEAVEKRQKARDNENDNKELYEAQEALRRATLDSSGKNNASLLQLQQELEDKQLEISEKRFEQDMEDRKNWLQDTKDAETETYEYRLETMTWYWEQVQIIQEQGTEAMMQTLITWNEQYRTTSELQQREMERNWQETMDAMKAATDMGAELDKLTADIVDVTKEVENMNISINKLSGTWQKVTNDANNYKTAVKNAANYVASHTSGTGNSAKTTRLKTKSNATLYNEIAGPPKSGDDVVLTSANMCPITGSEVDTSKTYRFNKTTFYKLKNGSGFVKARDTIAYKTGGMVDYTGPAWVDGTKSHPEAFLSAYQTEQIGALAGALDNNTVNNVSGDSNISFGSINFNVASMSSAADGKKALDIFVQGANDLMAKKGVNTKINLNIK